MKKLRKILSAALAALTLVGSLPVYAAPEIAAVDISQPTTPGVFIVGTTEGSDALFDAIKLADPNAALLYGYSEVFDGFSLRTSLDREALTSLVTSLDGSAVVYDSGRYKYAAEPYVASAATAVAADIVATESGLRGAGQVCCVIDASFDVEHPVLNFSKSDLESVGETLVHSKDSITELVNKGLRTSNWLKYDGENPYVSEKVPYAYDYAMMKSDVYSTDNHGTAVASVIAGNRDENDENSFDGIAPDAQLLLMKISDGGGAIDDYAVLAALDDAVKLGADVVNMSFGIESGFVGINTGVDLTSAVVRATNRGIDVFAAAGNEGRIGEGSRWDKEFGIASPDVLNPDYGTVGDPATLNSSIAVASTDNAYISVTDYIDLDGEVIIYSNYLTETDAKVIALGDKFGGKTLEYVPVGGIGGPEDYDGVDVEGKFALIERGEITFTEKVQNAIDAGAVGAVIYDNVESDSLINMAVEIEKTIPAVFVSRESGIKLLEAETKTFKVVSGGLSKIASPSAGKLSVFSSWGATPALTLKPDITAPGGNIRAATLDGGYTNVSGTSFASPIAAGCALLVDSTVDSDDASLGASHVRRLLMSTASVVVDPETGVDYSPRRQGAGLVQTDAALRTEAYVYSAGGECKLELGDMLGAEFTLEFNVRNLGNDTLSWYTDVSLITDGYFYSEEAGRYFVADNSRALSGAAITLDGGTTNLNRNARGANLQSPDGIITVGPLETRTFRLNVSLGEAEYAELVEIFENGFFLEGFVRLTPVDDKAEPLSIPYMGFSNDWGAVPIFDDDYAAHYLTTSVKMDRVYIMVELGKNIFLRDDDTLDGGDPDYAPVAISPDNNDYGDFIGVSFANVRNIAVLWFEVVDEYGEVVMESGNVEPQYKASIGVDAIKYNGQSYVWDGRDANNPQFILPEGVYTLRVCARPEWNDADVQTLECEFCIDRTPPVFVGATVEKRGGRTYLCTTARDESGIEALWLYESEILTMSTDDPEIEKYYDEMKLYGGDVTEIRAEFDITDHVRNTDVFYLDLIDYAYNWVTVKIDMEKYR